MDIKSESALRRNVILGTLFWIGFCLLLVLIRGVRWEESVEDAQIVLRQIPYPEGHPRFIYCRNVLSLQTYASAALLWLGAGPAFICGLRNVIALALSVLPVFLLTSLLSRKALWGHAAALLALQGIYLEFSSSYPMSIWPGFYSYGQIGMGCALLTLYLLVAGHWRSGFLLLALMPIIHVGQMPVLLATGAVVSFLAWRRGRKDLLLRVVAGGAIGVIGCVAFVLIHRAFVVSMPTSGAYYSAADPHAIWANFTAYHDMHRQPPPTNALILAAGAFFLLTAAVQRQGIRGLKGRLMYCGADWPLSPWAGLFIYGVLTVCVVHTVLIVQRMAGPNLPFWLIAWMPYRLLNHLAPILLAAVIAILAEEDDQGRRSAVSILVPSVLAYALVLPLLAHLVPPDFYSRYLETGAILFFGLFGAAAATLGGALIRNRLFFVSWAGVLAVGFVTLALCHRFGAFCFLVGLAAAILAQRAGPCVPRMKSVASGALCMALALSITLAQYESRAWLPVSVFNSRVAAYLATDKGLQPLVSEPSRAMLLTPPDAIRVQAETSRPVFAQQDTPYFIAYVPALGPAIEKMYREVYGVGFDPPDGSSSSWKDTWAARRRPEWHSLAHAYGFSYVIAPDGTPLDLPAIFREGPLTFYSAMAGAQ